MILFATVVAFVLTPFLAHAQFASQNVCAAKTMNYEDYGWMGGASDAIDQ